MAQAELESKLSGFQTTTLIRLSYSEGSESRLVPSCLSTWVRKMGYNSERKSYPGNSG